MGGDVMQMSGSVCLVVIYNHRHSANVERLENLYRGRFSHVYHLMPFHEGGGGENVIPVYESSHYFQGHLAQGYDRYFAAGHRHYIFVADDVLLNPVISEENYMEYFGLDGAGAKSFIPGCVPLHEGTSWNWLEDAFPCGRGVQIKDILPSYDETLEKFDKLGLTIKPIPAYCVEVPLGFRRMRLFGRYFCKHPCQLIRMKFRAKRLKWLNRTYVPFSPFVFGYSDICLVSSKHIRQFVYYCGVFAACNLFVEIALPTALTMCVEPGELVTEENISLRGNTMWCLEEERRLAGQSGMRLGKLLSDWPEGTLYIHPVKLSQWK